MAKKDKFFGELEKPKESQVIETAPVTDTSQMNHEAISYFKDGSRYVVVKVSFDTKSLLASPKVEVIDEFIDRTSAEECFKIQAVRRVFAKE